MQPGEEILHVLPQEYTVDNEGGIKETRRDERHPIWKPISM